MSGDAPTPKTVLVHEHDPATLPAAKKQRSGVSADAVPEEAKPKRSFKTIANLVVAMKRFQAALNPQYEYGKQKSQSQMVTATRIKPRSVSPRPAGSADVPTASPTTSSGGPQQHYAYQDRGHKSSFLFKELPPAPDEEADAASK